MSPRLLDSIRDANAREEPTEPQRRQAVGRLGGLLFCAGALVAALAALTIDPLPPEWVFGVIALAFGSGIASIAIPWARLAPRWLHAMPALAAIEITAGAWGAGADGAPFAWLYLIVVIMVAYTFRVRRVLAAHLALVTACLAVPLIDPPSSTADSLRNLLVGAPTLAIAGLVIAYFRDRLEAGKQAYRELSRRDPLTGVGNYRTLYERLDYEVSRHQRHQRRFVVMLLDLHDFKQVNDTYGHLEGDHLLREVGQALARTVRDQDTVARQGGDEFSVLAPETSAFEAAALAERLCAALEAIPVGETTITASVGWAIFPQDGSTMNELLAYADTQLRTSKSSRLRGGSHETTDVASRSRASAVRRALPEVGGAGAPS